MRKNVSRKLTAVALMGTLALVGCANMSETQRGTAVGAGTGAGLGAIIGAVAGGGRGAAGGAVLGGAAGAIVGNVWSSRMEEQKRQMEQATQGTGIGVSQTQDNRLKLDIPSDISFDVGRADVKSNFRPILDNFATSLNQHQATLITVVGHTDSTGSDAVNNPLSVNRASRTRDYLVSRGVAMNRFTVDGRGSYEPIAPNDTEANRARNRRVEIYIAEPQQ